MGRLARYQSIGLNQILLGQSGERFDHILLCAVHPLGTLVYMKSAFLQVQQEFLRYCLFPERLGDAIDYLFISRNRGQLLLLAYVADMPCKGHAHLGTLQGYAGRLELDFGGRIKADGPQALHVIDESGDQFNKPYRLGGRRPLKGQSLGFYACPGKDMPYQRHLGYDFVIT